MRNAEHCLYSYSNVEANSYMWGPMVVNSVGYQATNFWANVGVYYGVMHSPWSYSIPTNDELKAGIEGADDALFGASDESSCGCGGGQ